MLKIIIRKTGLRDFAKLKNPIGDSHTQGELQISSDRDDPRIFGFEILNSEIFWPRKIWQVFFWVA